MCLRENQHFHELDSHGSNAVVVRVEQLHDDLLHVDHEAPGRFHAVRDGLGLAQPFQRGPEKIIILIQTFYLVFLQLRQIRFNGNFQR